MIFITARFRIRPEDADRWPEISRSFTEATRAEPGCLWFDWSRSIEDPTEYVLVEAFADDDAGAAHVQIRPLQGRAEGAAAAPGGDAADRELRGARHRLVRARRARGRLSRRYSTPQDSSASTSPGEVSSARTSSGVNQAASSASSPARTAVTSASRPGRHT